MTTNTLKVCLAVLMLTGTALVQEPRPDRPGLPGQPEARQDLISEYIVVPSLAQEPSTPSELNKIGFLRIRRLSTSNNPAPIDAIVIYQTGFGGGAGLPMELLTQIVEMGALRGKNIEVWSIDYRENNLEDTKGMRRAELRRDPRIALQYYYGDDALDENGRFSAIPAASDSLLGGEGATFVPLQQEDVPFLPEWGVTVHNRDVETLLRLVPEEDRSTNVFLMGHSQGGSFIAQFAGHKLLDGKRGYEELAGLIFLDGGPSIGNGEEPSEDDISNLIARREARRDGSQLRFGTFFGATFFGPGNNIMNEIMAMAASFSPTEETIFPLGPGAAGGPLADEFAAKLRLTNRARFGFTIDTDPIPGTFLQTFSFAFLGARAGRLDFTPVPGTENDCAEPGPRGMMPPCVPALSQIDPRRVYDWIDGGPGGAEPSPLNGWTRNASGFTDAFVNPLEEPTKNSTWIQANYIGPSRTNVRPVTIDFPVSGPVEIDSGEANAWLWYLNNQYNDELSFVSRFKRILIDRDDVNLHIDIDKRPINIPVITYVRIIGNPQNPFPNVYDFTAITPTGVRQTPLAFARSPIEAAVNTRLYGHTDLATADNSKGHLTLNREVTPGDNGANVVSTTLVDWIIARTRGQTKVQLPSFR